MMASEASELQLDLQEGSISKGQSPQKVELVAWRHSAGRDVQTQRMRT